jgi:hypothetical protein
MEINLNSLPCLKWLVYNIIQGILTEGSGSVLFLLSKLACFNKKVKKVYLTQSTGTQQVDARRSIVLSLPLQLVFPVLVILILRMVLR